MDYQYDAFISHASEDFDKYAMPLVRALEETGLKCWIAPRNIPDGEAYSGAITEGLKASKCVIFLLSRKSNQSKAVHNEIELASRYDKKLITLKLEDLQYHSNLEFHLSSKQYINAKIGIKPEVVDHVIAAIKSEHFEPVESVESRVSLANKAVSTTTSSLKFIAKWFLYLTAFLALVIGGGLYYMMSDRDAAKKVTSSVISPISQTYTENKAESKIAIERSDIDFKVEYAPGLTANEIVTPYGPFWKLTARLPFKSLGYDGVLEYSLDKKKWRSTENVLGTPIDRASDKNAIYLRYTASNGNEQIFDYEVNFTELAKQELIENVYDIYRTAPNLLIKCIMNTCTINTKAMPVIKYLHYGKVESNLDYKIKFSFDDKNLDDARYMRRPPKNQEFKYNKQFCAKTIFYQFTFFDGSKSDIFETEEDPYILGSCK